MRLLHLACSCVYYTMKWYTYNRAHTYIDSYMHRYIDGYMDRYMGQSGKVYVDTGLSTGRVPG